MCQPSAVAEHPNLFQPLTVGPVQLRNRLIFGAHFTMFTEPNPVWGSADGASEAGSGGTLGAADPGFGAQSGFGADFDRGPDAFMAARPKKSSSRLLNVVLGLAVVVAIGGVAFAAGRLTAPAAAATASWLRRDST